MFEVYGYDLGTLSFFIFSFVVGLTVFFQSIFGCSKETTMHRIVRGSIGVIYTVVTIYAFTQIGS